MWLWLFPKRIFFLLSSPSLQCHSEWTHSCVGHSKLREGVQINWQIVGHSHHPAGPYGYYPSFQAFRCKFAHLLYVRYQPLPSQSRVPSIHSKEDVTYSQKSTSQTWNDCGGGECKNIMETWHLCGFFHEEGYSLLIIPHRSDIFTCWSFCLFCGAKASVDVWLDFFLIDVHHDHSTYSVSIALCCILPTFQPQSIFFFPSLSY